MAAFTYEAINAQGLRIAWRDPRRRRRVGARPASLARPASADACRSGPRAATAPRRRFKKVKPKSLQVFSRQLATMIEAGVSVVAAFTTLEQQTDDKYLRQIIGEVRADVETGMVLSKAFARHPKVFNRLFVAMVEAGESSGTLDSVLDRIAIQIEKETALKRRVKSAMVYPIVVMSFATLVLDLHAHVHRPGLPEGLRRPGRRPAEADAVPDRHVGRAARLLVHHLPGRSAGLDLRLPPLEEERARASGLGHLQAPDPDADRRRRAEDRARPLLAHAVEPRHRWRRHRQGARDHGRHLRATG